MRQDLQIDWSGWFTLNSAQFIFDYMQQVLEGKTFAVVDFNDDLPAQFADSMVTLRANRRLSTYSPLKLKFGTDIITGKPEAMIQFSDGHYGYTYTTSVATQKEAEELYQNMRFSTGKLKPMRLDPCPFFNLTRANGGMIDIASSTPGGAFTRTIFGAHDPDFD